MCVIYFYLTLIDINMVEVRINHFAWSKSTQGVHAQDYIMQNIAPICTRNIKFCSMKTQNIVLLFLNNDARTNLQTKVHVYFCPS